VRSRKPAIKDALARLKFFERRSYTTDICCVSASCAIAGNAPFFLTKKLDVRKRKRDVLELRYIEDVRVG
jgi:hypothetical protein